jgi:pantoate--beta-alanine ligase
MAQPDCAVFGEKDYQQLVIVKHMVSDLSIPVEIVGVPTQREEDGLAMSSRNRYLSTGERGRASTLYLQLCAVRDAVASGVRDYAALEERATAALDATGFRTEYVAVRETGSLRVPGERADSLVVLGAAWLGRTRLIDNVRVEVRRDPLPRELGTRS